MGMRASPDPGYRLVDLERLGDGHTSPWADIVATQTEKGGVTKSE